MSVSGGREGAGARCEARGLSVAEEAYRRDGDKPGRGERQKLKEVETGQIAKKTVFLNRPVVRKANAGKNIQKMPLGFQEDIGSQHKNFMRGGKI